MPLLPQNNALCETSGYVEVEIAFKSVLIHMLCIGMCVEKLTLHQG